MSLSTLKKKSFNTLHKTPKTKIPIAFTPFIHHRANRSRKIYRKPSKKIIADYRSILKRALIHDSSLQYSCEEKKAIDEGKGERVKAEDFPSQTDGGRFKTRHNDGV